MKNFLKIEDQGDKMKKNVMQIAILFFLSVSIYGQSNFTFYKAINVDVKNESNIASNMSTPAIKDKVI